MTGRPSKFSSTLAREICQRLVGGQSVREICRDAAMPGQSTIYQWLALHPDFRVQYARARALQAEVIFEETMEIADGTGNDNKEVLARSRLRVDARKWGMARMAPRRFGEVHEVSRHPIPLHPTASAMQRYNPAPAPDRG